jgi:hypothetical protein
MNVNLINKRVLFIGIGFYDYEDAIRRKIQELGAIVTYYSDKSVWEKYLILRVLAKTFSLNYAKLGDSHFDRVLKKIDGETFDYVLVIKGDRLTERFISTLRTKLNSAHFILYQWDSLVRIPSVPKLFPYFNKIFSFDRVDCLSNEALTFRPLFFRDECSNEKSCTKFDMTFIGLLHSERFSYIDTISKWAKENQLSTFFYLTTGLKVFVQNLYSGKLKFLHIRRLSYRKVMAIIAASKVIIDISHPLQSGLTMRTIEAIGQRKKIITTNSDVLNYDFYNDNNIVVFHGDAEGLSREFIDMPYSRVADSIISRYTLTSWVSDVFRV